MYVNLLEVILSRNIFSWLNIIEKCAIHRLQPGKSLFIVVTMAADNWNVTLKKAKKIIVTCIAWKAFKEPRNGSRYFFFQVNYSPTKRMSHPKEKENSRQQQNTSLTRNYTTANLFADLRMDGRWMTFSTYPESIDWNSFFETWKVFLFSVAMLNMSQKSLSASVALRLSSRPKIVIDFQFQSRAALTLSGNEHLCLIQYNLQGLSIPSTSIHHFTAAGKHLSDFSRFEFFSPKNGIFVCKHHLAMIWRCCVASWMHDARANRTSMYVPNNEPSGASRTTLISRLSSHVFSIVFFISIYAPWWEYSSAVVVRPCRASGFVCAPNILTHQTIIESS